MKIEKSHDKILEWTPTMDRLKEMAKPDGVFDKLGKTVERLEEKTENHGKQINIHWALITAIVLLILGLGVKAVV